MLDQVSLLTETEFIPQIASVGKRLLNYLLDVIAYYILCFFFGIFLAITNNSDLARNENSNPGFVLIFMLILLLYYFLCEFFLKGRTFGKFITGTKAVNEDGTQITAKTALLRTLCRIVPFEIISIFFSDRPWHDKWTHTYVIDVKKTRLNDINQA
jgi:uncharacterized RDD family membrane protein YckC